MHWLRRRALLSREDIARYSRQLLLSEINEEGQQNLANAHVVIIGLGGLGCLAAHYLVGAGVGSRAGSITLVDGDTVEISNLQRQVAYNEMHLGELKANALQGELSKVNAAVNLNVKCLFADSKNLAAMMAQATCVLDCTDNIMTRKQINAACVKNHVPLFIAAASGCSWQAINIAGKPQNSGCYACLVEQMSIPETCMTKGILGPVVGMAACHQATQVLMYLANAQNPNIQWGKYLVSDAVQATMQSFHLPPSPQCEICQ